MIPTILRTAAVAAALLALGTAQESQRQGTTTAAPTTTKPTNAKPATTPNVPTPRDQAKAYLDAHPELKLEMFEQADANDDGALDAAERETLRKLVEAKLQELAQTLDGDDVVVTPGPADARQQVRRVDRRDDRRDEARTEGAVAPAGTREKAHTPAPREQPPPSRGAAGKPGPSRGPGDR
ncbi:MAG: hypothetical protein JNK15_22920 [Planctomycetes bacterium]|nr:hypothetical protein [Planctomycetota bacterium]